MRHARGVLLVVALAACETTTVLVGVPQDIARFEPPGRYQDWWEHVTADAERPR